MTKTKATLLINRSSRKGSGAYRYIRAACDRYDVAIGEVYQMRNQTELDRVMRRIARQQPRLLIVAAGDGTISYIADHLVGTRTEIGIVPLGTTNNFARSLGLPLGIDAAIAAIAANSATSVDLGLVNNRHFTNVAGVGMSAEVAKHVSEKQKKRFGRLAYTLVGAWVLLRHKPFFVTIADKDKELQMHLHAHQLIIANGRFHAGKKIARDAKIDNRELLVFPIGGRSKLSFLWHMIDFYVGNRKSVRHASYLIAEDISIATDSPRLVELDGEVRYQTPARVSVRPRAVRVRYGRGA